MEKLSKLIYAVDFDGTLCENKFPGIGRPNTALIEFLKKQQSEGNIVILWTMRDGDLLDNALEWLMDKCDFTPDEVNDNIGFMKEFYGNNPRKVFANVYIDDHNAKFGVCADLPYKENE